MARPNKLTIEINGIRYPIKTVEAASYVMDLAEEIDAMVRELMGPGNVSMNEALVLAALSSLDTARKAEQSADNLRDQIAGYVEDAAKARLETGELRREINRLEKQLNKQEETK